MLHKLFLYKIATPPLGRPAKNLFTRIYPGNSSVHIIIMDGTKTINIIIKMPCFLVKQVYHMKLLSKYVPYIIFRSAQSLHNLVLICLTYPLLWLIVFSLKYKRSTSDILRPKVVPPLPFLPVFRYMTTLKTVYITVISRKPLNVNHMLRPLDTI